MATQDNTARGLNWRGIFAIALTSIAHLMVFGIMLMPGEAPEQIIKPPIVDIEPENWEQPPPPPKPVVVEPVKRVEAVVTVSRVVRPAQLPETTEPEEQVVIVPPTEEVQALPVEVAQVPAVDEVSEAQIAAQYGVKAQVDYPPVLRKRGVEGSVLVRVLVGEDGRVVSVEIAKPSRHAAFDRSALRSVAKFKFNPKKVNGVAQRGYVLVPVNFRING